MNETFAGTTCTIQTYPGFTDEVRAREGQSCVVIDSGFTLAGYAVLVEFPDGGYLALPFEGVKLNE